MKKVYLSLVLIFLFSLPLLTQAAGGPAGNEALNLLGQTAVKGGLTNDSSAKTDVLGIISGIINTILSLTGIVFFAQMFYHGFRWMTSGGAEKIIEESKQGVKQSIIGVVIIFSSFVVTNFVLNRIDRVMNPLPEPIPDAIPAEDLPIPILNPETPSIPDPNMQLEGSVSVPSLDPLHDTDNPSQDSLPSA